MSVSRALTAEACSTALEGLKILKPNPDSSEVWIYDFGMLWAFSFSAQALGKFEEAIDATHKILNGNAFSASSRQTLEKNLFYLNAGVEITKFAKKMGSQPCYQHRNMEPTQSNAPPCVYNRI